MRRFQRLACSCVEGYSCGGGSGLQARWTRAAPLPFTSPGPALVALGAAKFTGARGKSERMTASLKLHAGADEEKRRW
jgi:hypothetical protein